MLSKIDRIAQIGFFVKDVEAAARHWIATSGVGPFFIRSHLKHDVWTYQGRPSSPMPDVTLGFSFIGDTQIELAMINNEAPCVYAQWKKEGRYGIAHTAAYCDDIQAVIERYKPVKVVEYTRTPGGVETIYLDTSHDNNGHVEFIKLSPEIKAQRERMKDVVRSWNGSNPIRYLDPANPMSVFED